MLTDADKQKIASYLDAYRIERGDFIYHNKAYERSLKADLKRLIKLLTNH